MQATITALISLIIAATACSEKLPENGAGSSPEAPALEEQMDECKALGGVLIIGGHGQPLCEISTKDMGKSCTQNSDCESFCLADGKTCAPTKPFLGCHEVLIAPNETATICVD